MINNGAVISGTQTISSNVDGITAVKGAKITVTSGGVITDGTIDAGAKLTVKAGASTGYINIFGEEVVEGRSYADFVQSGGKQIILKGGSGNSIQVVKGGSQLISGQGIAEEGTISGYQAIYSGGKAYRMSIRSGGNQTIFKGGRGENIWVSKGGVQLVSGIAENGYIEGSQTIHSGGVASATTVSSGGRQTILKGGKAYNCYVERGGVQLVSAGGSSLSDGYAMSGTQIVYSRAAVSGVPIYGSQVLSGGSALGGGVYSGGRQTVLKGGVASDCYVGDKGVQLISAQGTVRDGQVNGSQTVYSGGKAIGVNIYGKQIVAKGGIASNCSIMSRGSQAVQAGGKAIGTRLYDNSTMTLAGSASGVQVGQPGHYYQYWAAMTIIKGGVARDTLAGDKVIVSSGGVASATTVANGNLTVAKGGTAKGVTMYGGKLIVQDGANVSGISAEYPSYYNSANGGYSYPSSWNQITFGKNFALGGVNSLRNATVNATGALTVKSGAALTLNGSAGLQSFTTNVAGATINIRGHNNKVLTFGKVNAKTTLNFDVTKSSLTESRMASNPGMLTEESLKERREHVGLTVGYEQSYAGKLSISVNGLQIMDHYQLCDGLNFKKNASVAVKMNGKSIGSVKVGGTLRKNGVSYKLTQTDGGQYHLNMTAVAGVMRKGTAKNETLTGGANCDIFYAGAGNDTIKGVNGHDVVFYDAKKWGKDTIAATNGSMTIYMAGLDAGFLTTTKKGKDLVITRKGIASDSITIKNYNENTHNIIYGGTVGEYSKYLNSAKPTAAVQTAARDALWKQTGLLAVQA